MKEEYDFKGARRGAIDRLPPGKSRITIRLDDDVIEWFRSQVELAGGGNYQSLINAALRDYVQGMQEPLEELLRRVVREELDRSSQPTSAVSRDPDVHSGDLVFAGTRVPVDTLIDYLKHGHSVDYFLEGFPTVQRWQVEAFLDSSPDAERSK